MGDIRGLLGQGLISRHVVFFFHLNLGRRLLCAFFIQKV